MVFFGDLNQDTITLKPTYGANGVSVFQVVRKCMIIQCNIKNAAFMIDVHCMQHSLGKNAFF
jgi:hypothetical protein